MTTSSTSPYGGSDASRSSVKTESDSSLPSKTVPVSLGDLVVQFWKAVHCGDSVVAKDVMDQVSELKPSNDEEPVEGKSNLSPSGIDYWISNVEVSLVFVNRETVCFGKVGQGGGQQGRLCVKPNEGVNRCKISLHKTSKIADAESLTSGFYVGAPSNVTAVMMHMMVPEARFLNTKVIENWTEDSSFEMIKATAGVWKSVIRETGLNIGRLINIEDLNVDTSLGGVQDDETIDAADMSHDDLVQAHLRLEERINDLEALGGIYRGMIASHEAKLNREMTLLRNEMRGEKSRGSLYGAEDINTIKQELRTEVLTELSGAVVSLKNEINTATSGATGQSLNKMIFGSGGFAESMEKKMDRLTQQVAGQGVEVGDCRFNCLLDVETWMASHLKNVEAYGVFWDVVVALCSVPKANVEFDSVMANKKAVEAGKFSSVWNARHFSSFQTTFPPVLFTSASSSGLSAIQYRNKWTSKGQSGVKHDILEGVKRASEALKKEIRNLVAPGSEAALLAEAMHSASVSFVRAWISEMDSLYEDFVNGGMKGQAAWELCLLLTKAMFAKVRDARAIALDSTTPSVMLWASLQAHKIMQEFIQHDFRNHPHFAAVIVQTYILGNSGMTSADVAEPVTKLEGDLSDYKKVANKKFSDVFSRLKAVEEKQS